MRRGYWKYFRIVIYIFILGGCDASQMFLPSATVNLDDAFELGSAVNWTDGSITDNSQACQAYLDTVLGADFLDEISIFSIQFYKLGSFDAGEVLTLKPISGFSGTAQVFDADHVLIGGGKMGTDIGYSQILKIPFRRGTDQTYLCLFVEKASVSSKLYVRWNRDSSTALPSPHLQTVILNFSGRSNIPFQHEQIKKSFTVKALEDVEAREDIVAYCRKSFADYNLIILTDQDSEPTDSYSTVYVGPANLPFLLQGLSESVDIENGDPQDIAIVDSDSSTVSLLKMLYPDSVGSYLGMAVTHEIGHLLGLSHVNDPDSIMAADAFDGIGFNISRVLAKRFNRAPLSLMGVTKYSLGYQDAPQYLLDLLGPSK